MCSVEHQNRRVGSSSRVHIDFTFEGVPLSSSVGISPHKSLLSPRASFPLLQGNSLGERKPPPHTHACQWQISRHTQEKSMIYCKVGRHIHHLLLGLLPFDQSWLTEFFRRVIAISSFLFYIDVNHYSRSQCTASEKPGRKCYFSELCDYIQKHQGPSLYMLPSYTQKHWLKRTDTG